MKNMQRRRFIAEINIVPYVDVMLVLLVILMVTAPLLTQGVKVDLPQAKAQALPTDQPLPIIVKVNAAGEMFLNIAEQPNKPISLRDCHVKVAAAIRRNPKRQVLVAGDKQAQYDAVLQTMVLLQAAGAPSVGLETRPLEMELNSETS